jgi:predicted nucleic acid-binding protein
MKMPEEIFVDSSAWIALVNGNDYRHKEAASAYPGILKNYKRVTTSNLVVAETYVVLLKELGHNVAIEFLKRIRASPRILKIWSNENIEMEAEQILSKYYDQDFSYTDAVSFAIMNRRKIKKAFSVDRHFVIAGFANLP